MHYDQLQTAYKHEILKQADEDLENSAQLMESSA